MDDVFAVQLFMSDRLGQLRRLRLWGVMSTVLLFGALALWHRGTGGGPEVIRFYFAAGAVYSVLWVLVLARWSQRRSIRRACRRLFGATPQVAHRVTLTDAGIEESSAQGNSVYPWSAVTEITRTQDLLLVFVGSAGVHAIPVSAFPSPGDADAFLSQVRDQKAASKS